MSRPATDTSCNDEVKGYLCCSASGAYSFVPSVFVTVSWVLSLAAKSVCKFVKRTVEAQGDMSGGAQTFLTVSRGVGIWTYEGRGVYQGICLEYPDSFQVDSYLRAVRAFGIIVAVLGGLVMISIWFASCVPFNRGFWNFLGFVLLLITVFQGFELFVFNSSLCSRNEIIDGFEVNVKCGLDYGSNVAIAALVFWFVTAMTVLGVEPPHIPEVSPRRVQTVKTETTSPEGIKTVTTESVTLDE